MRPESLGLQFHATDVPEKEFMRAPALHIGTKNAARELMRNSDVFQGPSDTKRRMYPLRFSEHAQFHDEVLEDDEANEAHAQFLEGHYLEVPNTIDSSRFAPRFGETIAPERLSRVSSAVQALRQNKILRYVNGAEDSGSISHVVPTPHMNLYRWPNRDPQQQPVLPMDFSVINPSEITKLQKGHA